MKKFARAVCFCLIAVLLLALLNRILMPDTDFSADLKGGVADEPDYIMLGTSNVHALSCEKQVARGKLLRNTGAQLGAL